MGLATMSARTMAATILVGALAVSAMGLVAAPTPHAAALVVSPSPITSSNTTAQRGRAPATASAPSRAVFPSDSSAAIDAPAKHPVQVPPTPLVIHHVIDTGGAIRYGTYFWDDRAAAVGPLTITVDLKASVLSVFRGGDEIGTTAIIYGDDGKETPLGTFPIMAKDRHHVSNLYNAPMPYMLRLTRDGVSIHASAVATDYATHGCVGVPTGFARKLFTVAKVGDRVIITKRGLIASGVEAPVMG